MAKHFKIKESELNKLEYAFSIGCTDEEACIHANIHMHNLYYYQKTHPEWEERKKLLKKSLVLKSREVISKHLDNEDKQTAQWYLERKVKDEFSARNEMTGADGAPIQLVSNIPSEFTEEEKD